MDIAQYYLKVSQTHDAIKSAKAAGLRPWDPDDNSVWLVSTEGAEEVGGRANVATMVLVEDRSGQKRASLALHQQGRPFRLSVEADTLPGGPVAECLRIQSENLAVRRVADMKADKTRPFVVQVPGQE